MSRKKRILQQKNDCLRKTLSPGSDRGGMSGHYFCGIPEIPTMAAASGQPYQKRFISLIFF